MKILFAARMARYDLLRAVQGLAARVTKWSSDCDKALIGLYICYIPHLMLSSRLSLATRCRSAASGGFAYADLDFPSCGHYPVYSIVGLLGAELATNP